MQGGGLQHAMLFDLSDQGLRARNLELGSLFLRANMNNAA